MSIIVNGGAAQRSRVVIVEVPASEYPHGARIIDLTNVAIIEPESAVVGSTLVLTFQGSSLPDARYAVVPTQGHFHRLFGDGNGDGTVDLTDAGEFGNTYGLAVGHHNYNAAYDADGDGVVGPDDQAQFNAHFGQSI